MLQKIQEGSYGWIFTDKNNVYKISKSKDLDCSMIRETYMLSYLKDSEYVVNFLGVIPPCFGEKNFGFLVREKKVDRIQGIIIEKMDCNLKDFCCHIYEKYKDNVEMLKLLYKKIFEKCLLAVYELQKYNILHNDLKLINILVSFKDKPEPDPELKFDLKLCDFGLAIQTSAFGLEEIICMGTCKYSAPEMRHKSVAKFYKIPNQYDYFPQTLSMDLYSIGVIMCHVLSILTNNKPLEKITIDTFKSTLAIEDNCNNHIFSFKDINGDVFLENEAICIILTLLNPDPNERKGARNCLKCPYFNNRIPRFKFVECMKRYLKENTFSFDKELYIRFEERMFDLDYTGLPFEIFLNIYHCMLQLKEFVENSNTTTDTLSESSTNKTLIPFNYLFRISLAWVLSIYHHKENQRFKKMNNSKSDKNKFKKIEYIYRNYLPQIKIIPFTSMFKACEIKNEIHRQKIFNYIFSE